MLPWRTRVGRRVGNRFSRLKNNSSEKLLAWTTYSRLCESLRQASCFCHGKHFSNSFCTQHKHFAIYTGSKCSGCVEWGSVRFVLLLLLFFFIFNDKLWMQSWAVIVNFTSDAGTNSKNRIRLSIGSATIESDWCCLSPPTDNFRLAWSARLTVRLVVCLFVYSKHSWLEKALTAWMVYLMDFWYSPVSTRCWLTPPVGETVHQIVFGYSAQKFWERQWWRADGVARHEPASQPANQPLSQPASQAANNNL